MKKNCPVLIVFILLFFTSVLAWCKMTNKKENELLQRDIEFADLSRREGLGKAYNKFLTPDGIVLPLDGYPIKGRKNLRSVLLSVKSEISKVELSWKPEMVFVSNFGDLGFTCGKYLTVESASKNKKRTGYYGSAWKRNKNNIWQLAFSQGLFQFKVNHKTPRLKISKELSQNEKLFLKTELAFSKYSVEQGVIKAFYNFIAKKGIAVSPTGPPRTKETYKKLITRHQIPNNQIRLEWKPTYSYLSPSNDLGYNTGPYTYTVFGSEGEKKIFRGYFFTVWIKENKGWKFFYDGGNQISGKL